MNVGAGAVVITRTDIGIDFCLNACNNYQNCVAANAYSMGCYLYTNSFTTLITGQLADLFLLSTHPMVVSARSYVTLPLIDFIYNDIFSVVGVPDLLACRYVCDTTPGCINYFSNGNIFYKNGFANPSAASLGQSTSIVFGVTRVYYQQPNVSFTGAVYYTTIGNVTYCNVVCDALPGCTGYTIDVSFNCNFLTSTMDTTTYTYNVNSMGYSLVATNAANVNIAVIAGLTNAVEAVASAAMPVSSINSPQMPGSNNKNHSNLS